METLTLVLFLYFNILISTTLFFFKLKNGVAPKTKIGWLMALTVFAWACFSYYFFIVILENEYYLPIQPVIIITGLTNLVWLFFSTPVLDRESVGFGYIPRERFIPDFNTSARDLEFMVKSGDSRKVIEHLKKSSRLGDDPDMFDEVYAIEKRKKAAKSKLKLKELQHEEYFFEENDTDAKLLNLIKRKFD